MAEGFVRQPIKAVVKDGSNGSGKMKTVKVSNYKSKRR